MEGLHHGVACVTERASAAQSEAQSEARSEAHTVVQSVGDPHAAVLPRSANKPAQAVGMLTAGLDQVLAPLAPSERTRLLALATSSHSGEPFHLELVDRLLELAGLSADRLACPAMLPLDRVAAEQLLAAGGEATPRTMNCSGKHSAMLATCVAAGWPTEDYLDPGHPLQVHLLQVTGDLAGEAVATTVVDGCGAPQFALSPAGLATTFGRIAAATGDGPEAQVAGAIARHPEIVSGTRRPLVPLLAALPPGAVGKDGAEGVFGLGLPDGRGFAVKIADGAERAAVPLLVAALRWAGVTAPGLDHLATTPLHGGGRVVGEVGPLPGLFSA